ncbi:hypothetical protein [Aurantiacibacter luteus]|uniref:Glycerophosphoryl diester phosphodiesterase membrane domain-containing protein n=1 Tax=Aurantiacibacter luteus TaxID=1581420 RepID=A0A0G9N1D1_9SPHN|nr:hypothetical protein [Aurantiacibacter luteus]KLE35348.1 hypothetical protein AAW00_02555 [Aurantiacibacter luteus]
MAFVQTRSVDLGTLLQDTFEGLKDLRRQLAIYFGAFFAAGLLVDGENEMRGLVAIAATGGYFFMQYWLYQVMLRRAGLLHDEKMRLPGFVGMALLLILPILFAFNLFVIPGIILVARWIISPAALVAGPRNVFQALGDGWQASSSNTTALSLAVTVLGLIWLAIFVVLAGLGAVLTGGDGGDGLTWLGIHVLPVLLMGLSVAAYRNLNDETETLAQVFA